MQTSGNTATGSKATKPAGNAPATKPAGNAPATKPAGKVPVQVQAALVQGATQAATVQAVTPQAAHAIVGAMPTATQATNPAGNATVVPTIPPATNLCNAVANWHAAHTRGTTALCSYRVPGCTGIVFVPCSVFAGSVAPATLAFTVGYGPIVPAGSTLLVYRGPLAGGKLGRSGYGAAGIAGVFVVCNTLLPGNVAPAGLLVNVVLAPPTAKVAHTTAAVLAAGNVAVAGAGNPTATPATVAQVAAPAGVAALAAALQAKHGKLAGAR